MRRHAKALESLDRGHFAARAADLFDIEKCVLRNLLGQQREQIRHLKSRFIVLAHDLTPARPRLDPHKVFAFATEPAAGRSHTAIMAGALRSRACGRLGRFITDVSGGDLVIVDGNRGIVISIPMTKPGNSTNDAKQLPQVRKRAGGVARSAGRHRDGTQILLRETSSSRTRRPTAGNAGAGGVGLYRTEFLYLGKQRSD